MLSPAPEIPCVWNAKAHRMRGRMWRVKIESNGKTYPIPCAAVVSLSRWLEQVGVTTCTAWRWRKRGWLKTINIAGRQYLTQEAIYEFHRRASAGEFSQVNKVPMRKDAEPGA
jgi:hypothetical protein